MAVLDLFSENKNLQKHKEFKMSAFNKVLEAMQNTPMNGHARANTQNNKSLAIAYEEIKKLLKEIEE